MKIIACDLGDIWTGIAISDALHITARPLTTVLTAELPDFIRTLLKEEPISTIVLGYPQTMRGRESEQTIKIKQYGATLQKQFPAIVWVWWDERLSSRQAEQLMRPKTKEDKIASHAVAAALILKNYLDSLAFQSTD